MTHPLTQNLSAPPCRVSLTHGLPVPVMRFINVHEVYDMTGQDKSQLSAISVAQVLTEQDWYRLETCLRKTNQSLTEGEPERTMGRIMALLAHFFITPLPEKLHSAVFSDWLSVLAPYPNWAIERACENWLMHQNKKPFPRDILSRVKEEVLPYTRLRDALSLINQHQSNL